MAKESIKYEDISIISSALCYAEVLLDFEIDRLQKKGLQHMDAGYKIKRDEVKAAHAALQKIRKELHLADDYAYEVKFQR